jgi:glutathione S-transferase
LQRKEDIMTIELYVFPPSPRAFKVMALANHLGLDWTPRLIDLRKGEQKTPEYAALNPNMRMPTLKDGDYVLWESNAILQYLALRRPQSGLFPADERARLDVTRWQFWDLAHWDPACSVFAFEYVAKRLLGSGEPDQAALAKGTEAFHRAAKVLDGQLRARKFVTGDALTIADFSARRGHEPRRDGALPGRALWRDQPLARRLARAAGLAKDAGASRAARRRRGVTIAQRSSSEARRPRETGDP